MSYTRTVLNAPEYYLIYGATVDETTGNLSSLAHFQHVSIVLQWLSLPCCKALVEAYKELIFLEWKKSGLAKTRPAGPLLPALPSGADNVCSCVCVVPHTILSEPFCDFPKQKMKGRSNVLNSWYQGRPWRESKQVVAGLKGNHVEGF